MEDYTDIILLSRDLMMHKEEANTLECDKMRMKRCIEKLKQDVEYEKLNLERDKKRLRKGQQTYANLCNAKSDLHKTFLEKERLKQTVDEDTKQLRYKITTMANQLEMEQADIQKLAMEDYHDDEFDENSSNEIILNLESTGQELVLYSQDLFSLNKKIKQSAWRLKYLSCQLTPDSIACDLSSEDDVDVDKKSCTFETKETVRRCNYSAIEVQATAEQHCTEVQASCPSTVKSAQTDAPCLTNNFVQTDEPISSNCDKCTEAQSYGSAVSTQTTSTPRISIETKHSEDIVCEEVKPECPKHENSLRKFSDETPKEENGCKTPVKCSEENPMEIRARYAEENPMKNLLRYSEESPTKTVLRCPEEKPSVAPPCDNSFASFMESAHRTTETWEDHFLDCPSASKTQNKITQTIGWRCTDELEDHPIRCVDLTKDQTSQTSRPTEQDSNPVMCQPSCPPLCQTCMPNCQPMYQSFYAGQPRMSPLCYTNDCSCSPSVMLYSRDCTPTYCNLTLPNQAPVRECASPPEQLGASHSAVKAKDGDECHRDLQSDQYPTKDDTDVKMKSAPNFVHYPYQGQSHAPASYPTIIQNRPNAGENWQQENELPNQDYPPNCSEHFFNPNLPTQDTRNSSNPTSQSNRDDSYYQVNVSPPEDCWTEIQSRFTGLLSLYTSDRMTVNSDSDLESVISTRPSFPPQSKKSAAKSASQVMPPKKANRAYK